LRRSVSSSLERGLEELVSLPAGSDRESSRSAALVAAGRQEE
jgi:hypothetical protein